LLLLLLCGLGILLAAASLFFRDVKYLVEAVITFAIFFTPVFYDVQIRPLGRRPHAEPRRTILEALGAVIVTKHHRGGCCTAPARSR
jgi:hypothetical protein